MDDPALAMALRVSFEEERARQEAAAKAAASEVITYGVLRSQLYLNISHLHAFSTCINTESLPSMCSSTRASCVPSPTLHLYHNT